MTGRSSRLGFDRRRCSDGGTQDPCRLEPHGGGCCSSRRAVRGRTSGNQPCRHSGRDRGRRPGVRRVRRSQVSTDRAFAICGPARLRCRHARQALSSDMCIGSGLPPPVVVAGSAAREHCRSAKGEVLARYHDPVGGRAGRLLLRDRRWSAARLAPWGDDQGSRTRRLPRRDLAYRWTSSQPPRRSPSDRSMQLRDRATGIPGADGEVRCDPPRDPDGVE